MLDSRGERQERVLHRNQKREKKMVTEQQKHKQKEPSLLNPGHLVSEGP